MNKLATISLVTVLGVAGGGAYMAMNPDKASDFAQYIPEPVTGLMNEYIPEEYKPAFLTQNAIVETQEVVQDQMAAPQQDESVFEEPTQAPVANNMQDNAEHVNNDQDFLNESMQEIQSELGEELTEKTAEPVQAVAAVERTRSSNPKAANIEKKIDGVNAEISKLDSENEQLKDRFQQILKKNRALAEQLKEIDEKLTATN